MIKKLIGPFILFFVVPFGALMILWKDHCEDIVKYEVVSPTGEHRAVTIETVCQSDAPTATQVFLSAKADGGWQDEIVVLLYKGHARQSPVWNSPVELRLDIPKDGEVLKHYPEQLGVRLVRYHNGKLIPNGNRQKSG